MSLDLTDIPDDFGSGGANLSPNGSSGEPSLKDILSEHKDALGILESGGGGVPVTATLTTLAAVVTLGVNGYPTGTKFHVTASTFFGPTDYTLMLATVGTADGLNIVATADDPLRVWVRSIIFQAPTLWPVLVNLTSLADSQLIPAIPGYYFFGNASRVLFKAATGTCTTGFTAKCGNNVAKDNLFAAAAISTGSINGIASQNSLAFGTFVGINALLVDTTSPVLLSPTIAAAGTGGFTASAWHVISGMLIKKPA